ncbi:hypothetical protein A7985_11270 [Pseudoalteromonas luteoviolacea]|uniref:Uncharacterized protein n=1 Tax=Pseudoalteromonas luteoviolacea TaxID=43657 RepID=A0A1C0TQH4_9GAMM|nr:hypothetical protein [Pseudoalteromonas luteoviolacea]OCQ21204.1 hypothetical protein A7985_11270 [Pseudoalteromonas luteoviolacea]
MIRLIKYVVLAGLIPFVSSVSAGVVHLQNYSFSKTQVSLLKNLIETSSELTKQPDVVYVKHKSRDDLKSIVVNKAILDTPFSFTGKSHELNLAGFRIAEIDVRKDNSLYRISLVSNTSPDWSIFVEFEDMVLYDYRLQGFLLSIVGQHQTHHIQIAKDYSVLKATAALH